MVTATEMVTTTCYRYGDGDSYHDTGMEMVRGMMLPIAKTKSVYY